MSETSVDVKCTQLARSLRTLIQISVLLSYLTPTVNAHAQEARAPEQTPEVMQPITGEPETRLDWEEAKGLIDRGEALFRLQNYEAALVDFGRGYALMAGHPRRYVILYNLGACHERMFRYDEALDHYRRYLTEGGAAAEDRAVVLARLSVLENMLANLQIEANVRGELWLDNRRMSDVPATLSVPYGRHVLEVRARMHETARRELTLEARTSYRLHFELAVLSNYRGISPVYFWVGAGLTTALLGTAGILGANTLAARDAGLERAEGSMHLATPEVERDAARVRDRALGTDLALAGAVVFGAATLVLLFVTDWGSREPRSVAQVTRRLRGGHRE